MWKSRHQLGLSTNKRLVNKKKKYIYILKDLIAVKLGQLNKWDQKIKVKSVSDEAVTKPSAGTLNNLTAAELDFIDPVEYPEASASSLRWCFPTKLLFSLVWLAY